ncbi:PorV/PorQ family protein, partial [candidate division KSB1 bacterium]|nr:PorV/PorQ family protein [candidate division KSB1 bacterium]
MILISHGNLLFAQSKVGTTVGQFLKIEPSARGTAIGNASTSLFGEAATVFYNPASIGRLSKSNVQFTHSNWLADIDYNYVVVALNVGNIGTMSLQATSLNSGEIDVRTVEQPMGTGERYSVSNFALGFGYARMLTDRVAVGMIVNYLRET